MYHTQTSVIAFSNIIHYSNLLLNPQITHLLLLHQGFAIEAELTKADHTLLPIKPEDSNVYLFRRFRVTRPTSGYNATGHEYIIYMTKWTEPCRVENPTVEPPSFYFNFSELEDIGTTIRGTRLVVGQFPLSFFPLLAALSIIS